MISITLFPCSQAELEIAAFKDVSGCFIRNIAADIKEEMEKTSRVIDKLHDDDWKVTLQYRCVAASHEDIKTREDLFDRLINLGIDLKDVIVHKDLAEKKDYELKYPYLDFDGVG
jgi:hypothetical protein